MFTERSEPPAYHGAPLHHQQIPGGSGPSVQPDVQDPLPIQTSSSAPQEGKESSSIHPAALSVSQQLILNQLVDFSML